MSNGKQKLSLFGNFFKKKSRMALKKSTGDIRNLVVSRFLVDTDDLDDSC